MKRVVEGAFFDLQGAAGDVLDPAGDRVAVPWTPGKCFQNKHIEGSFQEVERVVSHT